MKEDVGHTIAQLIFHLREKPSVSLGNMEQSVENETSLCGIFKIPGC